MWESILKGKTDVKFVVFKLCRKQIELAKAQPMAQDKHHPQSKINSKVTPEATVLVSLPPLHTATQPWEEDVSAKELPPSVWPLSVCGTFSFFLSVLF